MEYVLNPEARVPEEAIVSRVVAVFNGRDWSRFAELYTRPTLLAVTGVIN